MDPNATLEELLRLAKNLHITLANELRDAPELEEDEEPSEYQQLRADVMRSCELVEALDGWMRKGGFPPKAWER